MAAVKVLPRDLKPGDLWRHWTGTKTVALPIVSVEKTKRDETTVYKVRLAVPHRERNHIGAVRYVRPRSKVEIEKET